MSSAASTLGSGGVSRVRFGGAAQRLVARPLSVLGLVLVTALAIFAVFGPLVMPYNPVHQNLFDNLRPPSLAHLLGTDYLGRDVLSRLIAGARVSLQVGVVSVILAAVPGTVLGMAAAYLHGWVDELVNRFFDTLMAFPSLVLALTIVALLGPSILNVEIAIAFASMPYYGRLVRSQVLTVRELEYITAALVIGAGDVRIMSRHVLPNVISPVLVQASLGVGLAITAEASLSFLGVGVLPPTPDWGYDIQTGLQYLAGYPWLALAPGVAIFLAVLGFNLLGDGIREAIDPSVAATR